VAAVRAGDERAFEDLYHRYQRRIAAYVYGMVHDHGRAEDITQEVFMSALRRMRATDTPLAFKPWVYEIAKNACIDAFRRTRRTEEVSYDADDGGERIHLVSMGPTPDAAVDTRMTLYHLRGAFGGLSETHHQILVMRELEGLSYREIGERLGMSRPGVESTLFRARRRLTEEYEELASGERCRRIQGIIAETTEGHLGTRDQRRMGRHVSYCQSCRRAALVAGFDLTDLVPRRTAREKIAALLPLPAFLKRRLGGSGPDDGGSLGSLGGHGGALSHWSATAAHYSDSTMGGWSKAAALVATLAVAGVGTNAATHGALLHPGSRGDRPAAAHSAAPPNASPAPGAASATTAGRTTGAGSAPGQAASGAPGGSGSSSSGTTGSGSPGASSAPAAGGSADAQGTPSSAPSGAADTPIQNTVRQLTGTGSAGPTPADGTPPATKVQLPAGLPTPPPAEPGATVGGVVNTVTGVTPAPVGGAVGSATGAVGGAVGGVTGGSPPPLGLPGG
jgi:RNA polymerase sigma factor (sigma-70 family)